jgi:hypothetical protein
MVGFTLKSERDVRIETSGIACQPAAANSFGTFWVLPCAPHAWNLAAQNTANRFLPHSGRFCRQVCGKQHADHLRNALLQSYELTIDWEANVYSGMSYKWDYKNRTCDISMPGYVSNVLSKFQHDAPNHRQHTPSKYFTPVYGAKTQYATKDETPPLTVK